MKRDEKLTFGIIPTNLIFNNDLSVYEFRILTALISKEGCSKEDDNSIYSYEGWLADNLNMSLSTVKRAIKSLSDNGYILINKKNRNGHSINYYTINWDKINNLGKESEFKEENKKGMYEEELCEVEPIDLHIEEKAA